MARRGRASGPGLIRMWAALPGTLRSRALRRLAASAGLAGLLAAACAPASGIPEGIEIERDPEGFLVNVVDSLFDAGRAPSVALDAEGNPAVSYLLYNPDLSEGEIPPAIIPGQPQPPAVMLATLQEGIWSRTSVTPQNTSPVGGEAPEIADEEGRAVEGIGTAIATDGQGAHHVAWGTPRGLFYATDGGGTFGEPEKAVDASTAGVDIAVDGSGAPWISYYRGNSVQVSSPSGDRWAAEQVAAVQGFSRETAQATAVEVAPNGQPVVAFGDGDSTVVAFRSATGTWVTRAIPVAGGFGLSMDLDGQGNPHLAFYDRSGTVRHAHSVGGSDWQVDELAQVDAAGDDAARWGSGIGVTGEGVHHVVYADTTADVVVLATNESGGFQAEPVKGSEGGAAPAVAVSEDGAQVVVAWFDGSNEDLAVAVPAGESFSLAHSPQPAAAPTGGPPTAPEPECEPEGGTELTIAAPPGAAATGFDLTCLAVEAQTAFSVAFNNDDPQVPHNWSVYVDNTAGARPPGSPEDFPLITGPDSITYELEALDAGNYFYRCDVHPTTMIGTLVVASP